MSLGVVLLAASALGCAREVPVATAAERARVRVVLYTTRWCPVCARARAWFTRRAIPFRELDVETDPRAAAQHRRVNPARTVPVVDVDGEILVGFRADDVRRAVDAAAHRRAGRSN